MGVRDYKALLLNLLPTGLAWPREGAVQRDKMVEAYSLELDRVDSRVGNMLDEADPRTALETLPDWERITGLPDECVFAPSQTIQERRNRVVQKLTAIGGQSTGYYKQQADALGYETIFKEFRPFVCGLSECGLVEEEIGASTVVYGVTELLDLRYYWRVEVLEPRVTWFRVSESELGKDPLAKIDFADDLECIINKLKPAHTEVIFSYEG